MYVHFLQLLNTDLAHLAKKFVAQNYPLIV